MTEIKFKQLDNTADEVVQTRALVKQEVIALGVDPETATEYAFNTDAVLGQERNFTMHHSQYHAGYIAGRLVALSRVTEFTAGDRSFFAQSAAERLWYRFLQHTGNHIAGRPVGIPSLMVSSDIPTREANEARHTLLGHALDSADSVFRPVMMPLHESDPLRPVLLANDFAKVMRYGEPLTGNPLPELSDARKQVLYARAPQYTVDSFREYLTL